MKWIRYSGSSMKYDDSFRAKDIFDGRKLLLYNENTDEYDVGAYDWTLDKVQGYSFMASRDITHVAELTKPKEKGG